MHFPNHYLLRCGDYTLQPALSRRYVSASTHRCGSEIHRCRFRLSPCCACISIFNWINPNRQSLKAKEAAAKVGGIRKIFVFGPQEEGAISFSSLLEADGPVCTTNPLLFNSLSFNISPRAASLRPHQCAGGYSLASLFKWDHFSP